MKVLKSSLFASILAIAFIGVSCSNSGSETKEESDEPVVEETSGVTGQFNVNAENSHLKWKGKKVTGEHYGSIKIESGSVTFEDGNLVSGKFSVDMTSINVEDIEDEENNAKLTGHLKSDDFFDVENHNNATLVVTAVDGNNVKAALTIKGITNEVKFPISVEEKEDKVVVKGNFDVDRTLYNVKYGSGKFFDNLGDKMIYDNFNLDFKLKL